MYILFLLKIFEEFCFYILLLNNICILLITDILFSPALYVNVGHFIRENSINTAYILFFDRARLPIVIDFGKLPLQ